LGIKVSGGHLVPAISPARSRRSATSRRP